VATNVAGTQVLLQEACARGVRYLQVSTDEVYGSTERGSFSEDSLLSPSSPYSATKAAGDLLVSSYVHTFGLDGVICRGSNTYGPYQHPEKLVSLTILNALAGDRLPLYGDGRQVRNWLYVKDFCEGIATVLLRGASGEVYNCGGPDECENLELVRMVLALCEADESLIEFVKDRPGHDRRYSLSSQRLHALGWQPRMTLAQGLERTVRWYQQNSWWWQPVRSGAYRHYYQNHYGTTLGT
jgi:dTDP-glucose 4,6-dehydratase